MESEPHRILNTSKYGITGIIPSMSNGFLVYLTTLPNLINYIALNEDKQGIEKEL
jgi:hypothetical protein